MAGVSFWIPILVLLFFATLGNVLFKYGTEPFGKITFQRLFEFNLTPHSLLYIVVMVASLIAFFYVGYSLRPEWFAARYVFAPWVFLALVLLFFSRFLLGVPLSTTGLGRLNAIVTPLSIICTAAASALIFRETYSTKVLLGMGLAVVAVLLMEEQ